MKQRFRHYIVGTLSMLLGTFVVFGVVITMNELSHPPERDRAKHETRFEVKKEKKKPQKVVEQKEPPKKPDNPQPPPPMANLDSDIGSVDIPIPGLDMSQLGSVGDSSLGSDKDLVMTDDTVDKPPQPVSQAAMQYPPKAKARGVEGYVLVSLLIGDNGEVQKVRVLESKPGGVFEQTAVSSIRKWRFQPAQYQGKSVKVWARQKIRFTLG